MPSPLIYVHLLRLDELEGMVARLKREYIHAADRKRRDSLAAQRTWVTYSKVLHELRLRKREMNNGT